MDQPHTGAAVARRLRVALGEASLPVVLAVAVTLIGLGLRVEHALTFDGPGRGSDYAVYVEGVRWMRDHHRPFGLAVRFGAVGRKRMIVGGGERKMLAQDCLPVTLVERISHSLPTRSRACERMSNPKLH